MDKIKVIHIWKDFDIYYGIHDQLLSLAQHIDRNKFDLSICLFNYQDNPLGTKFKKLNVSVYDIGLKSIKNPLNICKIVKFLKRKKPHVVQTYCLNTNIYAGIAAKIAKVPVVILTELTSRDQAPSRLKRVRDAFLYPLIRIIYLLADSTIFISRRVLKQWTGQEESLKYNVIYPPFNMDKYEKILSKRYVSNKSHSEQKIGIVARLSEEKRHKDIIDAIPEIIQCFPKIKLLIVGTGPLEKRLINYVQKLDLADHVIFRGYKTNVFEELMKMDIFALPSRSEGLPIAIIEAMVAGIPIVATNVGGIPEVVDDGETGILVPPKNPSSLASAIIYLLTNPDKADQMGKNGRIRAFQLFSPEQYTTKHEKLYKELLFKKLDISLSGSA